MTIIQRIKDLKFPDDKLVVIGSGLLDAYGVRVSDDIDLVVSLDLYESLKKKGLYNELVKHDEAYLAGKKLEIWLTWGSGIDFQSLYSESVVIDGIHFINPWLLIEKKRESGRQKDLDDIKLLEKYLNDRRN